MIIIRTLEELAIKLNCSKKIILYGAGWAGKTICRFFRMTNIPIYSFAVTISDKYEEIEGIPVYGIDSILQDEYLDEIIIILAVTKTNSYSMEKELEKRKIHSYILLSDVLFYKMAAENRKLDAEEAELNKHESTGKKVGYLAPGYLDSDYAEKRLIIDKIEEVSYTAIPKEMSEFVCIDSEYDDRPDIYRQILEACYCPDRYIPETELIHTFNTVCDTDKPWCVSFETALPRMICKTMYEKKHYLQLVEHMKKPNCRALYALCQNACEIQKDSLISASIAPKDIELLMGKTKILHPPQEILISKTEFEKKHSTKKIHFIFIGGAFFLKGGREIIQVLSEFESKYDFDLTLISSLQYDDYFTKTPYEEMLKYKKIIHECKWIDYYESLPNTKVLTKCKEATVGLLPSVADTYGYAVLEMQAAGCPVVTTNVRAFPETNSEDCGWVCRMPVDRLRFCIERDTAIWSEILKCELIRCFEDIFSQPEDIKVKGRNAMERIKKMHDPYAYQKELRKNLDML